jgi:glycosyltransferase involved in cell wall biosynthesis
MHILLLNEYFPPDTSATAKIAAGVAAALAERHRVTVLAGRPSYDPTERFPFAFLRRENQGNVTIERVGSTTHSRHRMAGRVANYLSYLALAVPRAIALRADVVLAMTDPPFNGIAGAFIAAITRRPFVYNIRDLYPDMAVGGNIVQPGPLPTLWEKMHRWALRRARRIIVLGDDMRNRIISKGIDGQRVTVVRDGSPPAFRIASADEPATREIRCGFSFVLLHAGNLGFYGAWETLVRAAIVLSADKIGLVFVGDGASKPAVEAMARGGDSIRFLPFRAGAEIPNVMAAGDLHIVTVKRGLEGVVAPSKLYGILAAGRPVLAVAPAVSDVARLVRESGCGVCVEPEDSDGIVRIVRELRRKPDTLREMSHRATQVSRRFLRAAELHRFVEVVERAAGAISAAASNADGAQLDLSRVSAYQDKNNSSAPEHSLE